ncbi:hypothetical protein C1N74_11600 [Microbacterium sp. SGAir0570]|nr:hypothetical protein C1N74_11600 [Microbacterium sp. SGAir0570]
MTVVYSTHLVRVVVVSLVRPKHEVKVSLHPLSAARNIAVSTSHVFYHGVEEGNARHKDIRVEFEIHGQTLTLERARYNLSPITGDDAILAAFKALRAAVL